jgi:YD repeat-containing protein
VKITICLFLFTTSIFAQNAPSSPFGPVYDPQGHLVAYVYPDGQKETYAYDDQWRMISFRDRNGKFTAYSYARDGSMTVSHPKPGGANQ